MTNHIAYHTDDTSTVALAEGAIIKDFRGDEWAFLEVARGPEPGRSAKVKVSNATGMMTFYAHVFPGLEVI